MRLWFRAALPALLLASATAAGGELESAEAIQACVDANMPSRSSVQTFRMVSVDRRGKKSTSEAKVFWQRMSGDLSRVMMRFHKPMDLRGAGMLIIEKPDVPNDMFMYLPELKRVRRISGRMASGSMFGTDFSYEQFERLQGLADDPELRRLPDTEVDSRAVYVIESTRADQSESDIERVVSYVDKEMCLAVQVEHYENGDKLRKVLRAEGDSIERRQEVWIARRQRMQDLRDETETALIIDEIEFEVEIPRSRFTVRALESRTD